MPYAPAAPFSVKFSRQFEDVETVRDLQRRFKQEDAAGAIPFAVEAKLRPVLALTEPLPELRELAVLRLVNISRRVRQRHLTPEEERAIAVGEHDHLFPLEQGVVAAFGGRDAYAVLLDNPAPLHESAIVTTSIGLVAEDDFAEIGARVARRLGLV